LVASIGDREVRVPDDVEREARFEEAAAEEAPPATRLGRKAVVWAVACGSLIAGAGLVLARASVPAAVLAMSLMVTIAGIVAFFVARKPTPVRRRALVLSADELAFDAANGAKPTLVAKLGKRFGLTLLANRARNRTALVVTTGESTFFVGAVVPEADRLACRPLLASAFTVASDERALDPAAPDGSPFLLSSSSLVRLYSALAALDPQAASRIFLSDARGEPVVLDGSRLMVGRRSFDLTTGLEWRGMLFRESGFGGGVAVYQGTHVRQGSTEVVFVSLMPALSSPNSPGDMTSTAEPVLERAILRDMALMHETAEEPPSAELRVAVDRVFMLPLRAAVNGARQRTSSQPDVGARSRPLRAS
jgi:hypothetical protein